MGLSHASASIHLYISGLLDWHQMHGLEPYFCDHTLVHQLATRQTPNAWAWAMHLLPYTCTSAGYYTDTKYMGLSHASVTINLYISQPLDEYRINWLKPCICFCTLVNQPVSIQTPNSCAWAICIHTLVHLPATRQTPNTWAWAMHLLPHTCTSAGY